MKLDSVSFPSAILCEFYRFALLLCGNVVTAEAALAAAFAELEENLGQLRGEGQRRVWMAMRIRQHCLAQPAAAEPLRAAPRLLREGAEGETPALLKIEAYIFAQRFYLLPEPDRSALALFYLKLFSIEEIAALLKLDVEALGAVLGRARKKLRGMLEAAPEPALSHA